MVSIPLTKRANYYQDILIFTSAKHFQTLVTKVNLIENTNRSWNEGDERRRRASVLRCPPRWMVMLYGRKRQLWVGRAAETHPGWATSPSQDLLLSHYLLNYVKTKERCEVAGAQLMLIPAGNLKKLQAPSKNIYFATCLTC